MIYLDNAATTKTGQAAQRAMMACMEESWGNPSSLHTPGQRAAEVLEQARHWIDETEYTVSALSRQEMNGGAEPLQALADYAEQQGKLRHGL